MAAATNNSNKSAVIATPTPTSGVVELKKVNTTDNVKLSHSTLPSKFGQPNLLHQANIALCRVRSEFFGRQLQYQQRSQQMADHYNCSTLEKSRMTANNKCITDDDDLRLDLHARDNDHDDPLNDSGKGQGGVGPKSFAINHNDHERGDQHHHQHLNTNNSNIVENANVLMANNERGTIAVASTSCPNVRLDCDRDACDDGVADKDGDSAETKVSVATGRTSVEDGHDTGTDEHSDCVQHHHHHTPTAATEDGSIRPPKKLKVLAKSKTCCDLFANCECRQPSVEATSSGTGSDPISIGREHRRKKLFPSFSHPDTSFVFTAENVGSLERIGSPAEEGSSPHAKYTRTQQQQQQQQRIKTRHGMLELSWSFNSKDDLYRRDRKRLSIGKFHADNKENCNELTNHVECAAGDADENDYTVIAIHPEIALKVHKLQHSVSMYGDPATPNNSPNNLNYLQEHLKRLEETKRFIKRDSVPASSSSSPPPETTNINKNGNHSISANSSTAVRPAHRDDGVVNSLAPSVTAATSATATSTTTNTTTAATAAAHAHLHSGAAGDTAIVENIRKLSTEVSTTTQNHDDQNSDSESDDSQRRHRLLHTATATAAAANIDNLLYHNCNAIAYQQQASRLAEDLKAADQEPDKVLEAAQKFFQESGILGPVACSSSSSMGNATSTLLRKTSKVNITDSVTFEQVSKQCSE